LFLVASGQSANDVLLLANNQYRKGNYDFALKEYERYLFFEKTSNAVIFSSIADCYWNSKQYNRASEFYDKAFFTSGEDSLRYRALLRKVDCYIRTGDFGLALNELLSLNDSLHDNNYYLKEFYCGLCCFGMQDFTNAELYLINSINSDFKEQRLEITKIFRNKKNFYRPNPRTIAFMSMFIPGSGQLYTGDIKNSANSLLLLSLLSYLAVRLSVTESVLDAVITIAPWFQRYYQGGYTNAEKYAILKREENRSKIFVKISDIIASTKNQL
jgi:tetratricopeptide (TPR) repeat protein